MKSYLEGEMMKREEYLKELQKNLFALTIEEQNEAMEYYSSYFEDANDDEKVIEELGSPEELAKLIEEKFANALAKCEKSEENDNQKSEKKVYGNRDNLYFEFAKESVKNLLLSFNICQVIVISGEKYSVETRGIDTESFNCCLSEDGSLIINNTKKVNFGFWKNHTIFTPRILITIPKGSKLNKFCLSVSGGSFKTKDISLYCDLGSVDLGAGNVFLKSIYGGKIDFRVGMGNLEYTGTVTKFSNIDCGMGNLKLNLSGKESEYSYDVKLGLGNFKFNKEKLGGINQFFEDNKKENHLSVNCGMGNVNIKIGE